MNNTQNTQKSASAAEFVKKHLQYFVYGAVGVLTVIFASVMLAWALKGESARTLTVKNAVVVCDEGVELKTEYLVRQSIQTDGVSIDLGNGNTVPLSECAVDADLTSAGKKTVNIVYSPDAYLTYNASFNIDVIFVRGMEIESYPQKITVEDGQARADGLVMYATLAQKPTSDIFGEATETPLGWRIRLSEGMYDSVCTADALVSSFYGITYMCGDVSARFSFYNAADRSFIVTSAKDIVFFEGDEKAAQAGAKLTLVVTDRADYTLDCTGKTVGSYILERGVGTKTLDFEYEHTDREELFSSVGAEEARDGDGYIVRYDGMEFTANAAEWQSAVVNGNIVDDNGYKFVVDSDRRILRFDYMLATDDEIIAEPTAEPSLTLYVTDYDMNPLLGTGNGYSRGVYLYTDVNGKSYKMKFYLQAFVWTYVPLSANYADPYADATVSDVVYNKDAPPELQYNSYMRGELRATVSCFVRGAGIVRDVFTAQEEQWLGALLGL